MPLASPGLVADLAQTGVLRVAINLGNPVLAQGTPDAPTGVSVDIAREVAARLGTRVRLLCVDAARKSFEAITAGAADICFLAVEPARTAEVAFTAPYAIIEGVFAVPDDSDITTPADVDRPQVRIGVKSGSAYDLFLSRTLQRAQVVRGDEGFDVFRELDLEVAAGIRQPMTEAVARTCGVRLVDERFMEIRQALGTSRTRSADSVQFLCATIEELKASGFVKDALLRSGRTDATVAPPAVAVPGERRVDRRVHGGDPADWGTFGGGRTSWLNRLGNVRNVVRQEVIARQLDKHLAEPPTRVLDVGAGQGTQSIRLARNGHQVLAVEPDQAMREAFDRTLAREPEDVRRMVTVRAGTVDDLGAAVGDRRFDAVLLHGVLMYTQSSEPVLAELAERVAPGGVLSLAVRTTTSALWRPAARQDWVAALAAFAEHDAARREGRDMTYVNELGVPARADELAALTAQAAHHGLSLEDWYGVRIAVDSEESDPPAPEDPDELAALLAVEERLGSTDPFRQLGQLAHLVLRKRL